MNKEGFTLIEVALAVCVITVALFSMMSMFSTSLINAKRLEYQAVAVNLAKEKIEEYSVTPFPQPSGESKAVLDPPYNIFLREVQISDYTGYSDLKRVKCIVYWTADSDSLEKSFELETLVTN